MKDSRPFEDNDHLAVLEVKKPQHKNQPQDTRLASARSDIDADIGESINVGDDKLMLCHFKPLRYQFGYNSSQTSWGPAAASLRCTVSVMISRHIVSTRCAIKRVLFGIIGKMIKCMGITTHCLINLTRESSGLSEPSQGDSMMSKLLAAYAEKY